jgi:hypothetical protein
MKETFLIKFSYSVGSIVYSCHEVVQYATLQDIWLDIFILFSTVAFLTLPSPFAFPL